MKILRAALLVLSIGALSAFKTFAQSEMEEVVYLKNGNVYRGVIVEQIPNESIKIKTIGGNIFNVGISDVAKITKENKVVESTGYKHFDHNGMHPWYKNDSTRNQFKVKKKGFFFNAQILVENLQGGVRMVHGYKFNRFAYLGIGIGVDHVFNSPYTRSNYHLSRNDYRGVYFPLYLSFSGDMLNKRVTPFYAIEAGYAWGPKNGRNFNRDGEFRDNIRSGAVAGLGLGIKVNTKRGGNLSVLFNINAKQIRYKENSQFFDDMGNPYTVSQKREAMLFFPGIRFGLGF